MWLMIFFRFRYEHRLTLKKWNLKQLSAGCQRANVQCILDMLSEWFTNHFQSKPWPTSPLSICSWDSQTMDLHTALNVVLFLLSYPQMLSEGNIECFAVHGRGSLQQSVLCWHLGGSNWFCWFFEGLASSIWKVCSHFFHKKAYYPKFNSWASIFNNNFYY